MKIIISGGHLTPALAIIDYILRKVESGEKHKIVFFGREFSQEKLKQKAKEREEIEARSAQFSKDVIRFVSFAPAKFVHNSFAESAIGIKKTIRSIIFAHKIISQEKPDIFLSFGGYLAVPIAVVCWLKKIPIITHEQTRVSGFANKLLGKMATKIAVTFNSSLNEFPSHKTILTGNPVRKAIFASNSSMPAWIKSSLSKPIILVMGGNQGSKAINDVIGESLEFLTKDWVIIHQCGRQNQDQNYLEKLEKIKSDLPEEQKNNYYVREWLTEAELAWIYQKTFLAISRSGANSVIELALMTIPTIFVPLPQASKNEQHLNAQWLTENGGAIILKQAELNLENLKHMVDEVKKQNQLMRKNLQSLDEVKINLQADKKLFSLVQEVVSER